MHAKACNRSDEQLAAEAASADLALDLHDELLHSMECVRWSVVVGSVHARRARRSDENVLRGSASAASANLGLDLHDVLLFFRWAAPGGRGMRVHPGEMINTA